MSLKTLLKKNPLTYRAARLASAAPEPLLTGLCRLFHRLCGIDARAVFFSSFNGTLYNDNPRAVAEALHALRPDVKIQFCLNARGMHDPAIPDYVEKLPRRSLRALKAMSTARVLVKNAEFKPWMRKFPGQFYVQTWHGDRGFKRVRLDKQPRNPGFILREGGWIDLAVAGSDFGAGVFHSAFAVGGEVLTCGCPRNDLLLRNPPEVATRVRRALGIPEGAKVLLYAPTFRFSNSGGTQNADVSLEKVRRTLERATGDPWVCVTRSHELNRGIRSDATLDATHWPETGELLLATDLLITDYSSIGGDFMLLNRPVIYYEPDIDAYRAERGLYFDLDQSPLLAVHTEEALMELLSHSIDGPACCKAALEYFGTHECGHAAEVVAQKITDAL